MAKRQLVITGECKGCCYCLMICPVGAAGPVNPQTIDAEKCIGCRKCIDACPTKCRNLIETED